MGGHDQIVVVNPQIAHGAVREVELQRLPLVPIVERNPHARLRPREEQALAHGIFANGVDRGVVRQAAGDEPPGLTAVVRAVNVRTQIIDAEAANGGIGGFVVKMRSGKLRDFAPGRDLWRRDVFPIGAAIARDPKQTIVRARPDGVPVFEGRSKRIDDAANFVGVGILRRFVAEACRNRAVLACEVRTDGLPRLPPIRGLVEEIRGGIENVRVDRRKKNRLRAVGAHFWIGCGNGGHVLELPGGKRESGNFAAARSVHNVRIERIRRGVAVFDDPCRMPFAKRDFAVVAAARHAHRPAVLLPAANKIRKPTGRRAVKNLPRGLVVPGTPGLARVDADERALVAHQKNDVREVWIDP